MLFKKYDIEYYVDDHGDAPFIQWLESFENDKVTQYRIETRLDRVLLGNLGDHHSVGEGVSELRFSFGPGYRIYYGLTEHKIILLLCGGDKSSQKKDIKKAIAYWKNYLED
jgi:putative addiction module killer protein